MTRYLMATLFAMGASLVLGGVPEDIESLKKTPERQVWDRLASAGPEALVPILRSWPKDDPVAANWLRTAFDQIVRRHESKLPVDDLIAFAKDFSVPGRARRIALSAVERGMPGTIDKLLAGWLNDPEFGPDAVDRAATLAENLPPAEAIASLQKTFTACTDHDQVQVLAKKLTALGEKPDMLRQLGVVSNWHLVGPFPVTPEEGLLKSFPPETAIDLMATFEGKSEKLRWQPVQVGSAEGRVDLVKANIRSNDGAVAYAVARFRIPTAVKAELRLSAVDNITAWVNGKKVIERSNDYRSLYRTDRYRAEIDLPAGESTLLLKLTKTRPDEGQQAAAQAGRPGGLSTRWDFQARLVEVMGKRLTFQQAEGK